MQKLETRWLVVHSPQRTVIVVQHWDDSFHCTCGSRLRCIHIKKVEAKVTCKKPPMRLVRKKRGPSFNPIPTQLKLPDWFAEDFIPTRKFR